MNVDQEEIRKFQSVAGSWWNPEGPLKTLHEINPVRLQYIFDRTQGLQGREILDVGTGAGILAESMARGRGHVLGIDLAEDAIEEARSHARETGVEVVYRVVDVESLAVERPESFDVVTCMEMLEHVPDPASVVQSCARLLKPGGHAFFATLNRNPKSYLMAIVGAEYILSLLPRGTHDYEKFIRPSELLEMTRESGLHMMDLKGMSYDPWKRQAKITQDVSVNYLCWCQKVSPA